MALEPETITLEETDNPELAEPVFGWLPSPTIAAAAMSFSSVSVIGDPLRLRSRDI